ESERLPLLAAVRKPQGEDRATRRSLPTSEGASSDVEKNVPHLDAALRQTLGILAALDEERSEYEAQRQQVALRLEALKEDLQRHKDTQTLERFGSEHAHTLIAEHLCPTCRQHLDDGSEISDFTMTAAQSV